MNKILSFLFLALTACGPSITKSPKLIEDKNPYIAFIPGKAVEGISRERLIYISELARLGLESRGYILLSPEVIEHVCINPDCSNIREITGRYKIAKIAYLDIESSSNIDFLAGYYSSLTGQFNLENTDSISLYHATHTERDSGGLILESGQVIQAIINQIRNGDESSVDKLSYRFVSSLLKELPNGEKKILNSKEKLSIEKTATENHLKGNTKLCAYGTPFQSAWLISSKRESAELREVEEGKYCGIFRLVGPWDTERGLRVELRSPYGELVRSEVYK
ncbi:MAG TPA: hypothetical protein PKA63_12175 [Oligoflexia bacterium]|nr:hypothetical protein [Oligoflexia bacterium]HMP49412.1 hypothetical protein [Oligoflexia bacterium]